MDKQGHMDMVKADVQELRPQEPTKEMTEQQFLKELYLFMRKRDTPIERIPHLGFKQIDLFVMFKTVNDLGGYSQVTSQQQWKQVYNTLGGNPRSTSAATCTRRHYEKLLLPYECHMKGITMTTILQHHMKPVQYVTYGENNLNDRGPPPPKRRLLLPAHQAPHPLQTDPHGNLFPLSISYPHFFPPVLSPYVPIPPPMTTPQRPPAPKPQFPMAPPPGNPSDSGAQGLKQLRMLSHWYKTSSGLDDEPLNLSQLRKSPQESSSFPVSSFSPPSSSKTPKFLNKPSTLYTTQHAGGAPRNEGSETQEGDPGEGGSTYLYPVTSRESGTDPGSPVYAASSESEKDASEMPQKSVSPKTDFPLRSREADRAADLKALGLSHTLMDLSPQKDGKMEIEIPLSVFQSLFKRYRPSALAHKAKEAALFAQHEYLGQRKWIDSDGFNANFTFQLNPQNSAQDLRVRRAPSPTSNAPTSGKRHSPSPNHLNGYRAVPLLRNGAGRDVFPLDQQDVNKSFSSKSPHLSWDALDKEEQPRAKSAGSPHRPPPDFVPRFCADDVARRARQAEVESSAVLMVNSNSLLQLTSEEVLKLKKMISSSS